MIISVPIVRICQACLILFGSVWFARPWWLFTMRDFNIPLFAGVMSGFLLAATGMGVVIYGEAELFDLLESIPPYQIIIILIGWFELSLIVTLGIMATQMITRSYRDDCNQIIMWVGAVRIP